MRKIKDILRLRYEAGLAYRGIASALNIGYGTVVDYLNRAQQAGVGWPIPEGLHERDLGRLLFPTQAVTGQRRFVEPDFPTVCQELKRKGVTKQLLWHDCMDAGGRATQEQLPRSTANSILMMATVTPNSVIVTVTGWGASSAVNCPS